MKVGYIRDGSVHKKGKERKDFDTGTSFKR